MNFYSFNLKNAYIARKKKSKKEGKKFSYITLALWDLQIIDKFIQISLSHKHFLE